MNRDGFAFMNPEFAIILNDKTNYIPLYYFIETRINPMMKVRLLVGDIETNNRNSTASTNTTTPVVFGGFGNNPSSTSIPSVFENSSSGGRGFGFNFIPNSGGGNKR